jgi:hypothetical protein
VAVRFDDACLVLSAGLLPAAALAARVDLAGLVDTRVRLASEAANSGIKALTVIGSILAGRVSIDDTDLLRTGGNHRLFDQVRAPSTIGGRVRAFKWSGVRELDAVSRELLARLWAAGAGPVDPTGPLTFDLDSTIMGGLRARQTGFRLHESARLSPAAGHPGRDRAGDLLSDAWRKAGAARKARSFLSETVSRLRYAGATGPLTFRADSAFYSRAVICTARKRRVRFSITVRQDRKVPAAIEAIGEQAWVPIPYWLFTPEVSGADVAETSYTCFAGTTDAIEVRLIVRRVRPTRIPAGVVHRLRLPRLRHRPRR